MPDKEKKPSAQPLNATEADAQTILGFFGGDREKACSTVEIFARILVEGSGGDIATLLTAGRLYDIAVGWGGDKDGKLKAAIDAAWKKAGANTLPQLKSVTLDRHTTPNTYVSNALLNGDVINAGLLSMPVLGTGRQAAKQRGGKPITTQVMATWEPGEDGITLSGNYTAYDREVQDAVSSLYEFRGITTFTPNMVYRAMTGTDGTPSKKQLEAVTDSLEKQRHIFVKIDATEECRKRGVTLDGIPCFFKRDDYLLSLRHTIANAYGKTVESYEMNRAPILLEYAKLTGQLITVDSSLLDIRDANGKTIPNNPDRIALKGYLLRRIGGMQGDLERATDRQRKQRGKAKPVSAFRKLSDRVRFDTAFCDTGTESSSRVVQKRNRDYILACLNHWKHVGYIEDYTVIHGKHGAAESVKIVI